MPGLPDTLKDPRLRRLYDYWQSKCRSDRLPGRQHIDPVDFPDLLPHISILDVIGDGAAARFRYRLVGTANVRMAGREYTGQYLEDVFEPEDAARMTAAYRDILASRQPHSWTTRAAVRGNRPVRFERLTLPLASDGRTVDMLLAAVLFFDPPPAAP